jgi:hypothetical protein
MALPFDAALPPEPPDAASSRGRSLLRWTWRHPRTTAYGVAAVLMGCLVAAIVANGQHWEPSTSGLPPNQAGYLWCCGATDVAATWEVPRLMSASPQSAEGVWIGLQSNSGNFFLQVGTQDNASSLGAQYEGFWSNGPLHGAPVNLGDVDPGDVVHARLARSGTAQWSITFADLTKHWSHTSTITYGASADHAFAEWIEEDPAAVVPFERAHLFPMARTDGTVMQDLRVNGGVPVAFDLQPESFVDGSGTTFSPSSLTGDSFHFAPW